MRSPFITIVCSALAAFVAVPCASGAMVSLSLFASTESGPAMDPAELLADVFFELPGGVGNNVPVALPTTLTVILDNRTDETTFWDIQALAFNVPDNVTSLVLTAPPVGWTDSFDNSSLGGFQVNGFGMFDVTLIDGVGGNPAQVLPGEMETFILELGGTGFITEFGFISEFAEIDPGMGGNPMIVAAKFVNGPGDASGFGATNIPEPSSLALLALGALAILRRWRS